MGDTDILIRAARHEDLPVMQAIARRTIDRRYRRFLGDEGVDWYLNSGESDREVARHLDRCDVLLVDGAVIAFSVSIDDLIHLMMVDADRHREGIGSRLLAHTEAVLAERGVVRARLETFEGNEQALRFYRKNGWSETGRAADAEHGLTRVVFEKSLAKEAPGQDVG